MDASMGGRIGPSPPPLEKINVFFLIGGLLHDVAPFLPFVCYLSPCPWGGGGGFLGLPPPLPTKIFAGTNFCRHNSGVVGNFSCGSLSWHGHISYRYRSRGGGGACMNGRLLRVKIHIQTWGVYL